MRLALGIFTCLALLQSSLVLADGRYIPKDQVHIPCYNGGFTFGLAALYLRPSTSHLDYAVTAPTIELSNDFGLAEFHSNSHQFDWGYTVYLGYMLPRSATEIRLTYTNFDSDESRRIVRGDGTELISVQGGISDSLADTSLRGKSSFDYQALDLDLSQSIIVGCGFKVRYFGGLRYADLDHDFDTRFEEGTTPFLLNRFRTLTTHASSDYWGIGPSFGAEGNYNFGCGFGMVGGLETSVLIGQIDSRYRQKDDSTLQALVTEEIRDTRLRDEVRVVPNIDARLGFDYHYQFCNYSRTMLAVEAGYQVIHYFNTVERIGSGDLDEPALRRRQTLDTTFDGPYVGIQVKV